MEPRTRRIPARARGPPREVFEVRRVRAVDRICIRARTRTHWKSAGKHDDSSVALAEPAAIYGAHIEAERRHALVGRTFVVAVAVAHRGGIGSARIRCVRK